MKPFPYIRYNFKIWWRSTDNISVFALLLLVTLGIILLTTASPAVAQRIETAHFHFAQKQLKYLIIALPIFLFFATLKESYLNIIALFAFITILFLMMALPIFGDETKGAKRWLTILGFSLQPAELLKPFYAIFIANILILKERYDANKCYIICAGAHIFIVTLLTLQPDLGMAIVISLVTGVQFFVAGISIKLIVLLALCFFSLIYGCYIYLPHVAARIEAFLGKDSHTNQMKKSLESYNYGGFLGTGPGEGQIKYSLPDSHTDFIFAVAGEEFGTIFCILLVILIMFIVIRGLLKIMQFNKIFHVYIAIPMIMYFALQSMFNIGVTLNIFPTKGMTLPFISYGGSSLISFAIAMGIYINIGRTVKRGLIRQFDAHCKLLGSENIAILQRE
jgi:cell division protein FtsW